MKKKGKQNPVIKTKRVYMTVMTEEEILRKISSTEDAELKKAYEEMLEGAKKHENFWIWYAPWKIVLKENGKEIGDICFKGEPKDHAVEIGYGMEPEYEGKGFMTEAARAMTEWAFSKEEVYFVEAEACEDNRASIRILEKLGFQPDGKGLEGPRFVKQKEPTAWMPIYMCFGVAIGTSIGTPTGNLAIGMSLGICIGMVLGACLDSNEKKKLQEICKKREDRKQVEEKL